MRSAVIAMALTVAAVLATGPTAASPATATARTWTVRPGGAVTATAGSTTLKDTTTGTGLTCQSSKMSGTLKQGAGLPGTGIGSVTAASYVCASPIVVYHLTPGGLPWQLSLTSYDARTGVGHGTISRVRLAFSITEFQCSAVVGGASATSGGQVAVSYSNKTGTLKLLATGSTLHWYRVHKCAGLIADGDPASLTAGYAITPKQVITSP
jgi:hypothetical protein